MIERIKTYLFLIIILLFQVSCKKTSESFDKDKSTSQKVESADIKSGNLRIMGHWYGEGKKESLVRESVRDFSLLNQDYSIKLEFPHHIFRYTDESLLFNIECDSIANMVRTNQWPWDVLFCDQERYKRVGEKLKDMNWGQNYLVDFSEKSWFNEAHKEGLFETLNFKERYGGIIPGPILEGITDIMFVSEEVEKLLGISVKDFDLTSEDFIQYAKAVDDYNKIHTEKISFYSTQLQNATQLLFTQYVMSAYGKKEPGTKQEALNAIKEAYEEFEALSKYKPIVQYEDYSSISYDKAQRILYHKKFLFIVQPTWMYLLWSNSNPEGAKMMRPSDIPSIKNRKSPYYPGFMQAIFVVPKNSNNSEGAEKFIKFITSKDVADKWIKYSKCPTGMKNSISYSDFGEDRFEKYFRKLQQKYGNDQIEIDLSSFLFKKPYSSMQFSVNEVLNGKISSAEAMKIVRSQIQ